MHLGAVSLLLVLVVAVPVPAAGQENVEKARSLSRSAKQLATDGNYTEALSLYEQAYALYPTPELLYTIGRVADRKGDLPRARQALERYLNEEKGAEGLKRGRAALQEVLAKWPAFVRVVCPVEDAVIEVDGKPVGRTPLAAPLELSPGKHALKVLAPRKKAFEQTLEVKPQEAVEVVARLEDEPAIVTLAIVPAAARVTLDGKALGPGMRKGLAVQAIPRPVVVKPVAGAGMTPLAAPSESAPNDLSGSATIEKSGLSTTSWVLIGTGVAALVAGGITAAVLLTRGGGYDESWSIRTAPLEVAR